MAGFLFCYFWAGRFGYFYGRACWLLRWLDFSAIYVAGLFGDIAGWFFLAMFGGLTCFCYFCGWTFWRCQRLDFLVISVAVFFSYVCGCFFCYFGGWACLLFLRLDIVIISVAGLFG